MRFSRIATTLATACLGLAALSTGAHAAPAVAPHPDLAALANATPVPISQAVARVAAKRAAGASFSPNDCEAVYFTSAANSRIVSAEFGWSGDGYGMLRARATAVGPWEEFGLCPYAGGWAIGSLENLKWVSTEISRTGDNYAMLRARATDIGPWEQYTIETYGSTIAIRSKANGKYVSAELGWSGDRYGMLRARAGAVGPWEKYY